MKAADSGGLVRFGAHMSPKGLIQLNVIKTLELAKHKAPADMCVPLTHRERKKPQRGEVASPRRHSEMVAKS